MTTLFISDLHLDPSQPAIAAIFLRFLQTTALKADTLYILGDFFEYWIGDDDHSEFIDTIKAGLKQASAQIPIYFIHGNRDFLLGKRFARETGIKLLADPTRIDLYG